MGLKICECYRFPKKVKKISSRKEIYVKSFCAMKYQNEQMISYMFNTIWLSILILNYVSLDNFNDIRTCNPSKRISEKYNIDVIIRVTSNKYRYLSP